jgi:SAM-dependent methyltransferase
MSGMIQGAPSLETYFSAMADENVYPNTGNLRFYVKFLFDGVSIKDRSVLEIGGGKGTLSFFAGCSEAKRVLCLEPEAAGSSAGMQKAFHRVAVRLGLDEVRLEPATLQQFDPRGETFDLVLLHNSINHLDEKACVALRRSESARARYRDLFAKIATLTRSGGVFLATDCSPYNFFGTLGLRNPLMPTIEWHKHQSPWTWAGLLGEAGFERPRIRWTTLNSLRAPGRILFGNACAAFFLTSHFCLTMSRR